jgi:hypothetical protein
MKIFRWIANFFDKPLLDKYYQRSSKPIVIRMNDYKGKLEIEGYDDEE